MWSACVLFGIFFPPVILGLDWRALEFSLDYFKYRNDKFVCLLTCGNDAWTRRFVRQASQNSLRMSASKMAHYSNMASVHSCLLHTYVSVGVVVDPTCPGFEQAMYHASENTLLDSRHQWLIIHKAANATDNSSTIGQNLTSDMFNSLGALNISVDADISLAVQGPENFEIYELYNFGKIQGGDLIINKLGTWSKDIGFDTDLNEYKYYRRWNFHQWSMRLIAVVLKPEQSKPEPFDSKVLTDRRPSPGVATVTKTSTSVLSDIADIHGIRFIYSLADRWIGELSRNKSKALVATALYFREQDITPVLRFLERINDKVDFLQPHMTSIETRYYYLIPTYGAGKFENQFLRPLSTGAWVCVIGVITLCVFVLLMAAKLEMRQAAGQYAIFSVMASMCQQSGKLTILVTGLSCLLIYNYYTSSVVSWLLNGPPPSINSLQELLASPLELIFEDIGYTRSWLQSPDYYYNKRNAEIEEQLKKKVFAKKNKARLLMPLEEGIKLVKAGGYAYHTEPDSANRIISRTFTQTELCKLGSLQSMEKTHLYSCMQKNSPYKEFFNWSLMRFNERGIIKCIQQRTISQAVRCEGSSPRALALGGAAPVFLLLFAGFLLATAIMMVERAIWRRESQPKLVCKQKRGT